MMRFLVALPAIWALAISTPAHAQEKRAAELVDAGRKLAERGDFAAALSAFKAAVRREPGAVSHCYVALTYFKLKRYPAARLALGRAEAMAPMPDWCRQRLTPDLRRTLRVGSFSEVDISSQPAGATVTISSLPEDELLSSPAKLWLALGSHRLTFAHAGYASAEVTIEVTGKELMPVNIVLAPVAAQPDEPPPPTDRSAIPPQRDQPATRGNGWGWVTLSAGVITAAGGGILHARALSTKADAEKLYSGPQFDAALADFERRRLYALGGYAIGAVLLGTGIYLLLRSDGKSADTRHVVVDVASEGVAISWRGRWR